MIQACKKQMIWAAGAVLGAALVSSASSSQELTLTTGQATAAPKIRKYEDGPLTERDFLGRADASKSSDSQGDNKEQNPATKGLGENLWAYTMTDIHFEYKYRKKKSRRYVILRLTELDAFAVLLRDKSWNNRREDQALLDHEQGHFDLTYARSLQARLAMKKILDKKQISSASARTEKEAVEKMAKKIKESLNPIFEQLSEDHKNYDKLTHHGVLKKEQAEQRRLQRERIQFFADKLEAYESTRKR